MSVDVITRSRLMKDFTEYFGHENFPSRLSPTVNNNHVLRKERVKLTC